MKDKTAVLHPLKPVWDTQSRILILGTMPSPASRAAGFYYGHPRNRFWPALCAVLGEPLPADEEGKKDLLLRRHIALWDVLASCTITGAQDAAIRDPVANDFAPIFKAAQIRRVFATGKTAARLFDRLCPQYGCKAVALPSPSPANCAVGFDALCESYRQILPFLEDEQ